MSALPPGLHHGATPDEPPVEVSKKRGGKPTKPPKELALGDTVYLNSGSPRMTVVALKPFFVKVAWIKYDDGVLQEAILPVEAFRKDWK